MPDVLPVTSPSINTSEFGAPPSNSSLASTIPGPEKFGFFAQVGNKLKFLKESWKEMDPCLKVVGVLGIIGVLVGAKFTIPVLIALAGCLLFLSLFAYGIAAYDVADQSRS